MSSDTSMLLHSPSEGVGAGDSSLYSPLNDVSRNDRKPAALAAPPGNPTTFFGRLQIKTIDRLPEYLRHRILADIYLLKGHFIQFAFVIILIAYVQTVWARTTAFYRHKQIDAYVTNSSYVLEHRLKDMGYEVFPDWSTNSAALHLNETCQYFTGVWLVLMMLYPYLYDTLIYRRLLKEDPLRAANFDIFDYSPVKSVSMGIRFALCLAFVETMRMPCYLVTTLPGPSAHCIGPEAVHNRPKHYVDAFFQPRTGVNCGDLIFSGHISFLMTATMTGFYYFPRLSKNRVHGKYFAFSTLAVIVIQICLILCTRSHYSVDLVVGLIVGFLAWQTDRYILRPVDRTPPGYPFAFEYVQSCRNKQIKEDYLNGIGVAVGGEYKMWSLVRVLDPDDDDFPDYRVRPSGVISRAYVQQACVEHVADPPESSPPRQHQEA